MSFVEFEDERLTLRYWLEEKSDMIGAFSDERDFNAFLLITESIWYNELSELIIVVKTIIIVNCISVLCAATFVICYKFYSIIICSI